MALKGLSLGLPAEPTNAAEGRVAGVGVHRRRQRVAQVGQGRSSNLLAQAETQHVAVAQIAREVQRRQEVGVLDAVRAEAGGRVVQRHAGADVGTEALRRLVGVDDLHADVAPNRNLRQFGVDAQPWRKPWPPSPGRPSSSTGCRRCTCAAAPRPESARPADRRSEVEAGAADVVLDIGVGGERQCGRAPVPEPRRSGPRRCTRSLVRLVKLAPNWMSGNRPPSPRSRLGRAAPRRPCP